MRRQLSWKYATRAWEWPIYTQSIPTYNLCAIKSSQPHTINQAYSQYAGRNTSRHNMLQITRIDVYEKAQHHFALGRYFISWVIQGCDNFVYLSICISKCTIPTLTSISLACVIIWTKAHLWRQANGTHAGIQFYLIRVHESSSIQQRVEDTAVVSLLSPMPAYHQLS